MHSKKKTRRAKPAPAAGGEQLVYSGRELRGAIAKCRRLYVARGITGRKIGSFQKIADAVSAILIATASGAPS
jgi:hypothetical protein